MASNSYTHHPTAEHVDVSLSHAWACATIGLGMVLDGVQALVKSEGTSGATFLVIGLLMAGIKGVDIFFLRKERTRLEKAGRGYPIGSEKWRKAQAHHLRRYYAQAALTFAIGVSMGFSCIVYQDELVKPGLTSLIAFTVTIWNLSNRYWEVTEANHE